jgi:hypothetical protein
MQGQLVTKNSHLNQQLEKQLLSRPKKSSSSIMTITTPILPQKLLSKPPQQQPKPIYFSSFNGMHTFPSINYGPAVQ